MWAAIATRPNIAFTMSLLLQFMENPSKAHWEAIKGVFKYLNDRSLTQKDKYDFNTQVNTATF
jgi:hypothetical protein